MEDAAVAVAFLLVVGTAFTLYSFTGVSQEAVLLSLHLNEAYKPTIKKPSDFAASIWYPSWTGVLRSHNTVDAPKEFNSKIEVRHTVISTGQTTWLMREDSKTRAAESVADYVVFHTLRNSSRHALQRDLEWLYTHWRPEIVPLFTT